MAAIPLLTAEDLDDIDRGANVPGRLAKSWALLTRLIRERLARATGGKSMVRERTYRDDAHYLAFAVDAYGNLAIEFGGLSRAGKRLMVGRLGAHWDELGLTGPYRVQLRGRTHTLNTFCVVLERYLHLPVRP